VTLFNRLAISSLEDVFMKIADGSDDYGDVDDGTAAADAAAAAGCDGDDGVGAAAAKYPGASSLNQFCAIFWRRWVQVTHDA
jgi:hypothetical protein